MKIGMLQFQIFNLTNNLFLPFIEQQFLIVVKVLLAAVSTDKTGTIVADGQLCYKNQHFLPIAKGFLTEKNTLESCLPASSAWFFKALVCLSNSTFSSLNASSPVAGTFSARIGAILLSTAMALRQAYSASADSVEESLPVCSFFSSISICLCSNTYASVLGRASSMRRFFRLLSVSVRVCSARLTFLSSLDMASSSMPSNASRSSNFAALARSHISAGGVPASILST